MIFAMAGRILKGEVVQDTVDKTISVRVSRVVKYPKYGKITTRSRKYLVHDPENRYKINDVVEIMEVKPISKRKRWSAVY